MWTNLKRIILDKLFYRALKSLGFSKNKKRAVIKNGKWTKPNRTERNNGKVEIMKLIIRKKDNKGKSFYQKTKVKTILVRF